jgi:glycerol transport system ATP-binding protein
VLELKGVSRIVEGATHIAPTSLTLEPGSLNVLLGPTLAGKTSLLRLMAGLDRPTGGEVWFDGREVTREPVRRRSVAMVYQQFVNYPAMSVYENIASPLRVARKPREEIDRQVRRAAELLKLTPYLDRLPGSLSGGQQQRTAIARALAKGAALVLLDEPLANLDYKLREELRAELPRVFAETGAILVYATTEPAEALLLGGRTATLNEGCVTQFGPTAEVYRRPSDLVTAQTFSDPPLNVAPAVKAGRDFLLPGEIKLPAPEGLADGSYTIAVRPHHLRLAGQGSPIAGTVSVSEITGSESYIHFGWAEARWVLLAHGVQSFQPGDSIQAWIDPAKVMVFAADGRRVDPPAAMAA